MAHRLSGTGTSVVGDADTLVLAPSSPVASLIAQRVDSSLPLTTASAVRTMSVAALANDIVREFGHLDGTALSDLDADASEAAAATVDEADVLLQNSELRVPAMVVQFERHMHLLPLRRFRPSNNPLRFSSALYSHFAALQVRVAISATSPAVPRHFPRLPRTLRPI